MLRATSSGVAAHAPADHPPAGPGAGPDRGSRADRGAGRARLAGPAGPLRGLHRPVLAGQRQVRRLRGGLRLLRPVALRRGRDPDARDDGARADARARPRRRAGGRAPLLHGHPGPGPVQARLREGAGRGAAGGSAHQPQALRVGRTHVDPARPAAARGRHPARASQRGDVGVLLPGGVLDGPLRGTPAHDPGGARGGPGDLRGRHPQPGRDARAACGDGVRAGRARSHQRPHQPAQPAPGHQVRRPRPHGPVGGGEVDRHLPPDPARRPAARVRRTGGEPGRAAGAGGQGRAQRGDDGQLPHHAGQRARGGPRAVRGAGAQRGPPARQRRAPAARQPQRPPGRRHPRRGGRVPRPGHAGGRGVAVRCACGTPPPSCASSAKRTVPPRPDGEPNRAPVGWGG